MGIRTFAAKEWAEIRPNLKYDLYKYLAVLAATAMLTLAVIFMKSIKGIPDPVFYGVCFVLMAAAFVFLANRLGRVKQSHPPQPMISSERLVVSQHRTESAATPAELRLMSYRLAGDLASLLFEHDKPVDAAEEEEDGDLIDLEFITALEPFQGRITGMMIEFDQKGLLNDQVISEPLPKTLKQVLQSQVGSASDIRTLIQAFKRAAQLIDKRYNLGNRKGQSIPIVGPHISGPEIIVSANWPSTLAPPSARKPVGAFDDSNVRPFIVSNESEITAYNIRIMPIERNGRRVDFLPIDLVRKGEPKTCIPQVADEDDIYRSRSLKPLFEDRKVSKRKAGELVLPEDYEESIVLITDYDDSRGGKWETEQTLIYHVLFETARFRLVYCGPRRKLELNEGGVRRLS